MKELTRVLDLSNEQQGEIKSILANSHKEMKVLQAKYPELKLAKEDMRKLKDYKKTQTEAILTDEQLELMKSKRKNHLKEQGHFEMKKDADARIEHMKSELNLSDDQVGKLEVLRAGS